MTSIAKTTIQERSWGDVFTVIDRVVTEVNAEVPTTTVMPFTAPLTGGESPTEAEFNSLLAKLIAAGLMAAS